MKKYDVTLTAHYEKTISVYAESPEDAKRKMELILFDTERSSRMSEFIFFIIGTMLGGLAGVVIMCCLQINRLAEREEVKNAKTKCADTFPLD